MTSLLLILSVLLPLVLAFVPRAGKLILLAPLPALLSALLSLLTHSPLASVELSWLLLGMQLSLETPLQLFLLFTALLWLAASFHITVSPPEPRAHITRFSLCFNLAMSGNFLLILAADMLSFYLGFSLMGLAAYGLVVHKGNDKVRTAGRVYLVMTLLGEMALFSALVMFFTQSESLLITPQQSTLALWLFSLAMAIKAGLPGLHMWLPLAHPAAPIPASAVLSGAMIKAALVGWLKFLPLGESSMPALGTTFISLGLTAGILSLICGVLQSNPKVVLAYSSIGKMGLLVCLLGLMLIEPALASPGTLVLCLFAAHHGLIKGALFLSLGTPLARASLILLGIALYMMVSLPGSSGALAKSVTKLWLKGSELEFTSSIMPLWLTVSGLFTAALMARFAAVATNVMSDSPPRSNQLPVLLLLFAAFCLWLLPVAPLQSKFNLQDALWPSMVLVLGLVFWIRPSIWLMPYADRIPPGDLLWLLPVPQYEGSALKAYWRQWSQPLATGVGTQLLARRRELSAFAAGGLWLLILIALILALLN